MAISEDNTARNCIVDDKERYIECLFSKIAHRYDFLNSVLSFNLDKRWRRFAAELCCLRPGDWAIDVGTGTGGLAIELSKLVGGSGFVAAVDFCEAMLQLCIQKVRRMNLHNIQAIRSNASKIPFPSDMFKAAVTGFTVRNVSDPVNVFREMTRVVKSGGRVVCLEFSRSGPGLFGKLFDWYFHAVLPRVGGLVSGSFESYNYLPASVASFLSTEELSDIMANVGLGRIEVHKLAGGVVAVHVGVKK